MINYQEAEKVIKEYFKGHARLIDVVDDCKNVLDLLEKLDKVEKRGGLNDRLSNDYESSK